MTTVNKAHNDPSEDAHMQSDMEMDAVMKSDVAQDISRTLAITAPAVDSAPEFFATILGYMINPTHILAALIIYILANNLANCPSPTARNACALILSDKLKKLENTDNHQNEEEASSLYIATALLLKERIINIDNIYMELSPNREYELEAESAKWKSDMRKKADVISMAAMAGEEAHAMEETVMQDIAEMPTDVTRPNQKVELLTACLAIGEIETALVLLARMPKITATRPTLTDFICSTIRTMIQCLYDSNSPEDASVPYTPCQHRASWSLAPSPTEHHADLLQIVRDSELPRCCSLDGFTFQVKPLLEHVGARISRDPKLVGMLCQIGASALYRLSVAVQDMEAIIKVMDGQYDSEMKSRLDDAKAEYSRVEALVASVCCLLQYVSRDVRIRSYRRWQRLGVREPELMVAFAQIQTEAMSVLRRIDTENTSIPGSKMASLVLSSPQVVVAAVVDQIEKSNKIKTIVRVFRYFTDFGYELFDFALVEYLAKSSKPKFHADGTPAKWMKDLAAFCAQLYCECPSAQVEFVLRHIIERLQKNDPSELVVLKALLCSMGGVYETSCVDVVKMAAGVSLRDKAGSKGIISKELKSSQRLRAVMIHNNLGAHLLVVLAGCCRKLQDNRQTPQAIQNRFTGIIADQAYAIKLQLVKYLGANLQHEFSRLFPLFLNLCSVHNIEAGMVLTLLRPRLQAILYQSPMTLVSRASHGLARPAASTATMQGEKVWRKCLEPVAQEISAMLPLETWTRMAPHFVVTFWQLSLYDVFVPEDQYCAKIKKVIDTAIILESRYSDHDHQDERNDLLQGASRLRLEMEAQLENKKHVMDRLNHEKNHWFLDLPANSHETIHLVVQHCVAARARISAVDALYCAKFVILLHTLTPEIWGIGFYNKGAYPCPT
ncbi:THO complex subunit 2 [Podila horticola]|nr:THO complex subunit 2 [Podila horticola]